LKFVVVLSAVVVFGKKTSYECNLLESVVFESGSRRERIAEYAFCDSGVKSIQIRPRLAFIGDSAFLRVSLNSVSISEDHARSHFRDSLLEDLNASPIRRSFACCRSILIRSTIVVLSKPIFRDCTSRESGAFENGSRLGPIEESAFQFRGSSLAC
jgi:hypothetical protein